MKRKLRFLSITLFSIVPAIVLIAAVHGQKPRSRDLEKRGDREREEQAKQTRSQAARDENSERRLDDPAEEESLNRELWEFARRTPYDRILPYVAAEQRKSRAKPKCGS